MNEHGEDWRSKLEEEAVTGILPDDLDRAHEPGRGREANSPGEIPARGWADILWRMLWGISEDRILSTSGGVAFFALLAVFPAIATIVSLYGLFADTSTIRGHLSLLAGILPGGVLDLIGDQISLITAQGSDTLSIAFITRLSCGALEREFGGSSPLRRAQRRLWRERKAQPAALLRHNVPAHARADRLHHSGHRSSGGCAGHRHLCGLATPVERLLAILRWPILLVVVGMWLAVIYRYGPSRRDPKWRWVTWGSVMAAVLWLGASMLFSWYVANFDSYNKTYGSLGAGVGFMVWIWLSVVIVLLGADLNAEMEHQTARDSTNGPAKPLGSRGANMADHIGASHA
jgi:membrane protein